jgi:predicted nuclease of predicted toxin-antitoxin system
VPPEAATPTLFIDRDAWSHKLDQALKSAGVPFVAHRDLFEHDTPDSEWLANVGARCWVVLTRDQHIRHRPNELRAVRESKLHVFALTSGNLSAAETADLVLKAWPAIQTAVENHAPPMLWSITRGGVVKQIKR